MIRQFHALVSIGGITSLSLTFFHPAMWAPVGVLLAVALLVLLSIVLEERQAEPPAYFVAFIWIVVTALIALAYGFTEQLFNFKQVVLLIGGLLFGYFVSLALVRPWAAWFPFAAFVLYFSLFMALGREPGEVFSRNSQNYVSVILLALYVSAILMTRPPAVRVSHIAAAAIVVVLSIWAAGRGGILASLLLTGGLIVRYVTQARRGINRWIVIGLVSLVAAAALVITIEFLTKQGLLYKFEGRGLRDPSRLTILLAYFENIEMSELFFGRNYYEDSVIGRWGFNLHNSYLDAWAHLTVCYLAFILMVIFVAVRRLRDQPVMVIAVLAFAARALTDSQLFSGQYDYVVFATLFVLLRTLPNPNYGRSALILPKAMQSGVGR